MAWCGFWRLDFYFSCAIRAGDRLAECEPTGMLCSPLFHVQTALLFALLGLMLASSRSLDNDHVPYRLGHHHHSARVCTPRIEMALSCLTGERQGPANHDSRNMNLPPPFDLL